MKVNEYMKATAELCNSWRSASDKAHEAIRNIDNAVLSAAKNAEKAIKSFTVSFDKTYHCLVAILLATSLARTVAIVTRLRVKCGRLATVLKTA